MEVPSKARPLRELLALVAEWNIKERIVEKISVWGIKHIPGKIAEMPMEFLAAAFGFSLMRGHPECVEDYSQEMMGRQTVQLKTIYNGVCLGFFKREDSFQYTLVLIAKAMTYFLAAFCKNSSTVTESDVYTSLVYVLIGYQLDSHAYRLIKHKFRARVPKTKRNRSVKMGEQAMTREELKEKASRSAKKIHRKGINGLFQTTEEEKNMERFRLEVHEALHTRSTPGKKVDCMEGEVTPTAVYGGGNDSVRGGASEQKIQCLGKWTKGKSKVLNVNQVSAAMSIHQGFDINYKTTSQIHLSTRKVVREHCLPKEDSSSQLQPSPLKDPHPIVPSIKNWSSVIRQMKQGQKLSLHSQQATPTHPHNLSFYRRQPLLECSLNRTMMVGQTLAEAETEFVRLDCRLDKTIECRAAEKEEKKAGGWGRKSSSIWFTQSKHEFEKKCDWRREQLGVTLFPRIEKS